MKMVTVYTDGACSGNPGPGGWGAILEYQGHERELSGVKRVKNRNMIIDLLPKRLSEALPKHIPVGADALIFYHGPYPLPQRGNQGLFLIPIGRRRLSQKVEIPLGKPVVIHRQQRTV